MQAEKTHENKHRIKRLFVKASMFAFICGCSIENDKEKHSLAGQVFDLDLTVRFQKSSFPDTEATLTIMRPQDQKAMADNLKLPGCNGSINESMEEACPDIAENWQEIDPIVFKEQLSNLNDGEWKVKIKNAEGGAHYTVSMHATSCNTYTSSNSFNASRARVTIALTSVMRTTMVACQ